LPCHELQNATIVKTVSVGTVRAVAGRQYLPEGGRGRRENPAKVGTVGAPTVGRVGALQPLRPSERAVAKHSESAGEVEVERGGRGGRGGR
jgi:hypothetical protein